MDARPFRPARTFAVAGNENLDPTLAKQQQQQQQSLHQRYKSTGNLLQPVTGSLQAAAKRTAFADRSNTVRAILPDEPKLAVKPQGSVPSMPSTASVAAASAAIASSQENLVRAHAPKNSTKDAAFARPAQRPSSKSGLSSLPTVGNDHYIMPLKQGASQLPSQAPARAAAPKRASSSIYHDSFPRPSTSGGEVKSSNLEALKGLIIPSSESDSASAIQPEAAPRQPRHHQSQPALKTAQQTSNRTWVSHSEEDNRTETPYLDAVEELPQEDPQAHEYQALESEKGALVSGPYLPEATGPAKSSVGSVEVGSNYLLSHHNPAAEVIEISDDEEEEEFYDDQGFTTADSFRNNDATPWKKGQTELENAKEMVESKRTIEEIEEDQWDISMVAEYGDEIFEYMREMEIKLLPNPHYMDSQTEIQWSMRGVLMDWVVQVHGRFGLLPETLFLTANYIDRFLSLKVVSLGKLQLVGATAIFIAAKYEEINCPSVQEIVYMVDSGYTVDEILKAERFMLSMLQFCLGWPGPMSFLRRISKADDYDLETRTLSKYFLEVALMDERFVATPPSYTAAGAHCLSRLILEKGEWTPDHVYYSGYTFTQLKPVVAMMLDCCRIATRHHAAVFEKYSDKRYKRAATYVQNEIRSGFVVPYLATTPLSWPSQTPDEESTSTSYFPSGNDYSPYRMPIPTQC
ncbi:G2/mitotic-specific cyclin-4 [Apiospora kogelbergensis]|uniref:G2/mitotic-specific cyclin-4 n=1 Tax=Apiospora kogelbergensis TaxID=1337665 RepID=UPI00312FF019